MRTVSILLGVLCGVLVLPAAAQAEWSEPINLTGVGKEAGLPQVGLDADGDAVFAWLAEQPSGGLGVQYRARSAAGILSPVQSPDSGNDPQDLQVAVAPGGSAVFSWTRRGGSLRRLVVQGRSATGVLGPVQTVSPAGDDVKTPLLATDDAGNAVIAWVDGATDRLRLRARFAAGGLGVVQTISAAGQEASDPALAVEGDGDALVAWTNSDGAAQRIKSRMRSAAGTLGPLQSLSGPGEADGVGLGLDDDGDAVAAWRRTPPAGASRVETRTRSTAGALGAVQRLSVTDDPGHPTVGVDGDGDALFVWSTRNASQVDCCTLRTRARSAAGELSPETTLSGTLCRSPEIGFGAGGQAIVTWDCGDPGFNLVFAAERSPAGDWASELLDDDAGAQQLAVNSDGEAVIVWRRTFHFSPQYLPQIQAVFGP